MSLQNRKMFAGPGHGYFTGHHLWIISLVSQSHYTDGWLQAEKRVSDNGEESIYHCTLVGRIFTIVVTKARCKYVTKARCKYVIVQLFNILESRDHQYGIPTMHASPNERYQVVPPSVSCIHLFIRCHYLSLSIRISHSFSMLNTTVRKGSVVIQPTRWRRRLRERSCILPTTNTSSTYTHFTMHGDFMRSYLKTSPSLNHILLTVRSSTVRWPQSSKSQPQKVCKSKGKGEGHPWTEEASSWVDRGSWRRQKWGRGGDGSVISVDTPKTYP